MKPDAMKPDAMKPNAMKPLTLSTLDRDRLLLIGWAGLLLATCFLHPSLMAHDEGTFAAEARFMVESGRWLSRLWWDSPLYTHGVMMNWLMAGSYEVFGMGVRTARLPSAIACLTAVLLTYDISRMITGRRIVGFLSAAVLMLFHLWFQYGHLATQDMLLVCCELLGIWGLLQAEAQPHRRILWGIVSGVALGLGFLTKTFMIFLSVAALLPYLLFQQRRHRHLSNPGLYVGLLMGAAMVGLWLYLSIAQYGSDLVLGSLFGKISELGAKPFHANAGKFYYLWNIPANAFPWPLFSVIGAWFCWRDKSNNPYRWLLIYPFILAGMLTSFATRTPYYALQLHPFLAIFAAIALHRIATQPLQWPRRWLSFAFGGLGFLLAAIGLLVYLPLPIEGLIEIQPYAPIALVLGLGWMCLPWTMPAAGQSAAQSESRAVGKWLANWLLPAWLALALVGVTGMLGDYSREVIVDLALEPTAEIIATEPIDFLTGSDWADDSKSQKTMVLLSFYTPKLGKLNPPLAELTPDTYAWIAPNVDVAALQKEQPYETIADIQRWQLIHFLAL